MTEETAAKSHATQTDFVRHFTDGQSTEELATRYPGSAESHIMLHRKLDEINGRIIDLMKRLQDHLDLV